MSATVDPFPSQPVGARRMTAVAAFACLVALVAALSIAAPEDVSTQAALQEYLDRAGDRMFLAWVLSVLSGLAWLCLTAGLRRLLPSGGGRDLFVAAAIAGQAAIWVGASLGTAAAPPNAHHIPLAVFNALGEAAHLASAAGTAAIGLGLLGLAAATRAVPALLPRWFSRLTAGAGVVLVPGAVAGPVSMPVISLWLLAVGVLLLQKTRLVAPSTESVSSGLVA